MAYDKVINSAQLDAAMAQTAGAIRAKKGTSDPILWDASFGFRVEVEAIPASEPANYKKFFVTVPTAVAVKDTTVVSGDPDVAAHRSDETALCTVRKVSNNDQNGTCMIMGGNWSFEGRYGIYAGYYAGSNTLNVASYNHPLSTDEYTEGIVSIRCNSNGDIIVRANRQGTNFGGADYIVEFSW